MTRTRIQLNVGIVWSADIMRTTVGARRTPIKVVRKGKHKAEDATDAHNLDSTKPADVEPVVEVCECDMNFLDAVVEVRVRMDQD